MGISRYPRPGHKISPDLLAPVLEVPIPWRLINQERELAGLLSELDEKAWERWSPNVCAKLGAAVVREISSRIASLPPEILDQKLPLNDQILRAFLETGLDQLPLEARTYNCLVAEGIADSPEKLAQLTIADLLKIRSFGAKSLVDLLATLESLAHGEIGANSDLEPATLPSVPKLDPKVTRYPRPGHRLAPKCLREVLEVPIPAATKRRWNLQQESLADLDESIWEQLDTSAILKLGELVVQQVDASLPSLPPNIVYQRLPVPDDGIGLQNLEVERRTYNCLQREGLLDNPGRLLSTTIGDLLSYRGIGGKSLVDFLSALEHCHPLPILEVELPEDSGDRAREILDRLEKRLEGAFVGRDDPRVGSLLRTLDPTASSLEEVLESRRKNAYAENQLRAMEPGLRELEKELIRASQALLREELIEIASTDLSERDAAIIGHYFGWEGDGPQTLKQIGDRFGLTRERVRQIGVEQSQRIARTAPYAPTLRRALSTIEARTPLSDADARKLLAQLGIEDSGRIGLRTLRQAARLLEIELPFTLVETGEEPVAVPTHVRDAVDPLLRAARRSAEAWGLTNVDEVLSELGRGTHRPTRSTVSAVLSCFEEFAWLDRSRTWFWLPQGRNRLREQLTRTMTVARRVSFDDLREALLRTYRKHELSIPRSVLTAWIEQVQDVQLHGDEVVASDRGARDLEALSTTERTLVALLREHGPVLERKKLEELGTRRGLKRGTLQQRLENSPILLPWSSDRVGLTGTEARQRPGVAVGMRSLAPPKLVLELPEEGAVQGELPLPELASSSLVGKYKLLGIDGGVLGTLHVREESISGLTGFLAQRGGDAGDRIQIELNLAKRTATAGFHW